MTCIQSCKFKFAESRSFLPGLMLMLPSSVLAFHSQSQYAELQMRFSVNNDFDLDFSHTKTSILPLKCRNIELVSSSCFYDIKLTDCSFSFHLSMPFTTNTCLIVSKCFELCTAHE